MAKGHKGPKAHFKPRTGKAGSNPTKIPPMLLNLSYSDKNISRKVDRAVGKPFSIKERIALGGIGSPKLSIAKTSVEIHNLLLLDNNSNSCNIEIRPKGIIVRFRSLLETFGLIIPFYKLNLPQAGQSLHSIHMDQYFIQVRSDTKASQRFLKKIMDHRRDHRPPSPDGPQEEPA